MSMYILYEAASGYALFLRKESDEITPQNQSHQKAIGKYSTFMQMVQLHAFIPFESGAEALENMNAISEGVLTPKLKNFLEANLGRSYNITLGVADDKIKIAIHDSLGYQCVHNATVDELLRGIRTHFEKVLRKIGDEHEKDDVVKTQLGLSHAYSRAKIKFNANHSDNNVIQAISLVDQLDKDVNLFAMRTREWYSWHFPELVRIVPDNTMYARVAHFIGAKETLTKERVPELAEIIGDEIVAQRVFDAAKTSMGTEINEVDLNNIITFAQKVISLAQYRKDLNLYLVSKMNEVAPNLSSFIGETIGARLISQAGSLTNLAKCPASTIQILGAEKALFRALKTRGKTPKYGVLYNSSFIGKTQTSHRGRISRFLANKCSLAARIDSFYDTRTSKFGDTFKEQVAERLKFFETGDLPRKNVDVMHDLLAVLKDTPADDVQPMEQEEKGGESKDQITTDKDNMAIDESKDLEHGGNTHAESGKKKKRVKRRVRKRKE
eukprot:TRINITY_DN11719_c0_g1_i1.p1 TRINITY_DN11719_c0_g1~~TRINITY_DN11719_c0_g1_i1.p1  ORF type:complete len:496 (-),score=95.47 TRINITY_DN11719_c0_g1_i1:55-1542(-)